MNYLLVIPRYSNECFSFSYDDYPASYTSYITEELKTRHDVKRRNSTLINSTLLYSHVARVYEGSVVQGQHGIPPISSQEVIQQFIISFHFHRLYRKFT